MVNNRKISNYRQRRWRQLALQSFQMSSYKQELKFGLVFKEDFKPAFHRCHISSMEPEYGKIRK